MPTCPGDLEFFVCCVAEDRLSETCLSGPLSREVWLGRTGSVASSLELARDAGSRTPPQTYESESVFQQDRQVTDVCVVVHLKLRGAALEGVYGF